MGSHATMQAIDLAVAEQLVVDEMGKDFAKRSGVRTIQSRVAHTNGIHLTR